MTFKQFLVITACAAAILTIFVAIGSAQERRRETITAIAQGTSQQLGTIVNLTFIINEVSSPEDQKILIEAFQAGKSRGLSNAVEKMHSKGRISLTGTIGYDVNYIREFILPDGSRKIRFVTDRPIRFREAWAATRSMDYALSMGEIIIRKGGDEGSGTLMPAAKFLLDKEKELTIETFRNPWKLVNIKVHD
jgi:hypothetical protein